MTEEHRAPQLSEPHGAVFLSYASEDAAAAERLAASLRAAGIEVWFDRSELRGGDAWDWQIRKQIHDCRLFVPIISAHTEARLEGYFRREWKLAADRTEDMASEVTFLLPVLIDDTPNTSAHVPEKFRHVQWTRLPGGESPPAFVERVRRLLSPQAPSPAATPPAARSADISPPSGTAARSARRKVLPWAAAAALVAVLGYVGVDRFLATKHPASQAGAAAARATDALAPRSIAVLPFVNISGDKEQEYFSDGLSEELIDHLVHGTDLKVIARTSSFQFKGRNEDVRSIGRELGVTYVLEGSVRKEREQLRIIAQLIRASDGMHVWSQAYDRNLVDIFAVQDEIADEVSQALRVALPSARRAGSAAPDLRAYNLVLEGNYFKARRTPRDVEKAIQLYQQAIDTSPDYALAWARLASAYLNQEILQGPPSEDRSRRVLDALERAIHLDPNLVWAYYTRGGFEANVTWNWAAAQADAERIRELDPRFDLLPSAFGDLAVVFGEVDRAIDLYQQDLERNPLDPNTLDSLGAAQCAAGRLPQCLESRLKLLHLHPDFDGVNSSVGIARLHLGQLDAALAAMQQERNENYRLRGLALANSAAGRRSAADAALAALTGKFAASDAYGIAQVHAFRGETDDALRWLDRAYQQHDARMPDIKADPLLRKVRGDPRFQALLSRLGLAGQRPASGADART